MISTMDGQMGAQYKDCSLTLCSGRFMLPDTLLVFQIQLRLFCGEGLVVTGFCVRDELGAASPLVASDASS